MVNRNYKHCHYFLENLARIKFIILQSVVASSNMLKKYNFRRYSIVLLLEREREYTVEEEMLLFFLGFYTVLVQILYRVNFVGFSSP